METNKKLQELRKLKGYSQSELANLVGVSRSAIAGYENGYTQPSLEILCKLCEIFNISIDSLMDFDNINPHKDKVLKRSNIRAIKPKKVRKDRSLEIKQVVVIEVDKVLNNLYEEMIKAYTVSINKKDLTKEQKEFVLKIIKNTNQLLNELYA